MVAVAAPEPARRPADLEHVALRPLRAIDRPAIRRWMRDPEVIRYTVLVPGPEYAPVRPYPPAAADRYLRTLIGDPARRSYAVVLDDRHVGNVGLKEIDAVRATAECFIEIGETDVRRSGVGTRAMELLCERAFGAMQLTKLRLGVFEFNERALRLYQRLGFSLDGLYGWHFAQGRFWRVHEMSLDRDDWLARFTSTHVDA
jgi:RimJ/RimL family protein N-acetyltransferase